MRVRIRFQHRLRAARGGSGYRPVAAGMAALLSPLALMAGVLGVWRICADIGIARAFAISEGMFSHWQIWIVLAVVIQAGAGLLNKYGAGAPADYLDDPESPLW